MTFSSTRNHNGMCGDSGIDHLEMSFASSPLLGEQLSNPAESGGSFYHSFPSPLAGRSPTLPSFRIPKYGYYSLEQESVPPDGGVSHYTIRAKSSVFNAFLQSVNFFFGIGVLALPYALRMTGWFGLVLLATFGSAMTYTASIFGKNRDHFILESFSDHIEFSFSVPGRVTISFLFYVALLLNAGIYVKVLVTALSSLVSLSSSAALMIVSCLFVLIANTITSSTPLTLHVLGILGTLSTVLLLAALIGSECFALSSSPQAGQPPLPDEASESEIRVFWTDAVACFKTIGIFGYCFMGHEVFPSIFHNMQEPQQYMSVVAIAFSVMQVSYAAIASLGYLAYGNHAQGNVVQNLPPGEVLTVVVHVCVLLAVLTKLCFVTAPLTEGVMEWVQLTDYLMRRSKQFKKIVGKPTRSWSPAQSLKGTYGTMPLTDAEEKPAGNMALDLARPADRQQYFQAQPDQFTPEKARQPAGSRDTALLDAPPLQTRRSSLSFTTATERIPDPDAASRPSFSWSATIPIPAIRSPSCEALPLFAVSSSVGSLPRSAGVLDLLLLQAKNQPGAAVNPDPAVQSVPQSLSALVGGMNAVDAEWGADSSSVDLSSPDSSIDSLGYKHSSFSPRKPHGTSTTLPAPPPSVRTALLYHKYHQHCRAATPCSLEQGPTAPQPHKESTIMNSEQLARFAVRTAVPLLAVAVSLLFHCFASMVVFVGGVCGGTISIVIPCLTYLSIHKHRLGGTERCATWGLVAAGGVLVLATFVAFAL